MTTVRQLLDTKGHHIWSVSPETTVYQALELMADKNIGAVLVLDRQGRMCGILSERDYARKVTLSGKSSRKTPVSEIMTARVLTVHPDQTIEDCMALMTDNRLRHLPVMEGNKLIGLISIGDVVKAIIDQQEFVIDQLETYIMGRRVYA